MKIPYNLSIILAKEGGFCPLEYLRDLSKLMVFSGKGKIKCEEG